MTDELTDSHTFVSMQRACLLHHNWSILVRKNAWPRERNTLALGVKVTPVRTHQSSFEVRACIPYSSPPNACVITASSLVLYTKNHMLMGHWHFLFHPQPHQGRRKLIHRPGCYGWLTQLQRKHICVLEDATSSLSLCRECHKTKTQSPSAVAWSCATCSVHPDFVNHFYKFVSRQIRMIWKLNHEILDHRQQGTL